MGAWLEVWSRPGDPAYTRRIADLPFIDASADVVYSGVGKGSMRLPSNYSRLDEILLTDPVTPANSVWSTIKVVSDDGVLYEWLPSPRVPDGDKSQIGVDFAGDGIESMWGWARVEPWDWDGTGVWASTFPDWVWGGRNLLGNPGMEDSSEQPIIDELVIFGTGGTFTLSDGTFTTIALAFNASAATIETQLEAAGIYDDVLVTGTGTEDDPYIIEAVDPFQDVALTVNPASLTGGTTPRAILTRTQFGSLQPNPWTKSQTVSRGVRQTFGSYANFRVVSTQAHSGSVSLLINPNPVTSQRERYAGAQQVLRTKAGGIYQASVWVYPTSGTDTFRFIIRGIDGDFIAASPGGLTSTTLTPNTWNQMTIPDVNVGDNTAVIFRIAVTNPVGSSPSDFYVDDGAFNEGMAPTTVGAMLEALYEDAVVDHVADGRLVWEYEIVPGTSYLSLDFDDTVDSDGAAWDRNDVSHTFRPRMSYLQVINQIVNEGGYEWRLVPDLIEGTYKLQVYNPGTLGSSVAAGIVGGSSDTRRQGRYFAPTATDVAAQGGGQLSARATDAGLVAAFGRIEGSFLDQGLFGEDSLFEAASEAVTQNRAGAEALVYTLQAPAQKPLGLYRPGDTIVVHDPGLSSGARRVSSIQLTMSKAQVDEYVVSLSDASPFRNVGGLMLQRGLTGAAATDNAVAALLKAFQRADEPEPALLDLGGGGGAPTAVFAPSDSSELSKDKADIVGPGTDDTVAFQQAVDLAAGGRLLVTEGIVQLTRQISIPTGTKIEGMGMGATTLRYSGAGSQEVLVPGNECTFTDFTYQSAAAGETAIGLADGTFVQRVYFFDIAGLTTIGVAAGSRNSIVDCQCEAGWLVKSPLDLYTQSVVANNSISTGIIDIGDAEYWTVTGNVIEGGAIIGRACKNTVVAHNSIVNYNAGGAGDIFGFSGASTGCLILGNTIEEMNGAQLRIAASSARCTIAYNVFEDECEVGIDLVGGTDFVVVGNTIRFASEHGIRLNDVSLSLIADNLLDGPGSGTANTYDGIFLEGDSNQNSIIGNVIYPFPGFGARYGINVSAAACDQNVVVANNLGIEADYATTAYNDAGTGTVNTWSGGAVGDNVVI